MSFELTEEQYQQLIFALGYAAGTAHKNENKELFWSIVRLTNAVGAHSPNYIPYAVLAEGADDGGHTAGV